MADNPNFVPTYSTDEVYIRQDFTSCLSDILDAKVSESQVRAIVEEILQAHSANATTHQNIIIDGTAN